jgi:glutaredoxin
MVALLEPGARWSIAPLRSGTTQWPGCSTGLDYAETKMSQKKLALYNSDACWFCARVRQTIEHLGLEIEIRDAAGDAGHRAELVRGGGKFQVPCLRIEDPQGGIRWMYESADICRYLEGLPA